MRCRMVLFRGVWYTGKTERMKSEFAESSGTALPVRIGRTGVKTMEQTIQKAIEFIKNVFKEDFSGHDFYHSMRVYRMALKIAEAEKADTETVALAALLHDGDDRKLSPQTAAKKDRAVGFMRSQNVPEEKIRQICTIIDEIFFKGTDSVRPSTLEGKCVQDADRLDALGAIGIARTFAYGGNHNRSMYDPDQPPQIGMDQQAYQNSNSCSLNHFYEKLFLLEEMMNTESGKTIAAERTQYMKQFVDRFLAEWDGLDD